MTTKIEWVKNQDGTRGETWNPITGCTPISAGCKNCYARRMSKRPAGRFGYPAAPCEFDVTFHPDKLEQPLHWKKPRTVFVCSMSDLFHIDVRRQWLEDIFAIIKQCPQHVFQILTKRPGKMKTWFEWYGDVPENAQPGVTAEDQEQADKRIPILLQIPAAVRFVSVEPMLEAVDMQNYLGIWTNGIVNPNQTIRRENGEWQSLTPNLFTAAAKPKGATLYKKQLDWVIVGAEIGPGKRPMDLDWARGVRDQCQAAGVPFFFKKDSEGRHELDGRVWEEMPDATR